MPDSVQYTPRRRRSTLLLGMSLPKLVACPWSAGCAFVLHLSTYMLVLRYTSKHLTEVQTWASTRCMDIWSSSNKTTLLAAHERLAGQRVTMTVDNLLIFSLLTLLFDVALGLDGQALTYHRSRLWLLGNSSLLTYSNTALSLPVLQIEIVKPFSLACS
ncbi:hypothetical protein BCR43DRAFT_481119 [Syncephalastrum racemosum]|uniref:Uncharacterized protein n=1 Tax=Syncephalastrum racemosum TaxID=13706 RepID=A0A1X2HRJ3_SYNRA|nr:hypothetical protein BCR43DRAFT_481119 [Syncephalastrum racemosum]